MSTPNDTPAAKALPPSLDPPLGELSDAAVIAFQRLAQAEDIVASAVAVSQKRRS